MSAAPMSDADRCWINNGGFRLDGKTHMTGAQIRALPMPSIRDTDDLYLEVPGSEDVIVQYDEIVPVVGRRFFSVPSIINAGSPAAAKSRASADGGTAARSYHEWLDEVADEALALAEDFERKERRARVPFIRRWYAKRAAELREQEKMLRG